MARNTKNTPVAQNTPATAPATPATQPSAENPTPVINGIVTHIEQPKAVTVTLYARNNRDIVRFDVTAKPFSSDDSIKASIILNPDTFVALKTAEAVPEGTTVYANVRAALLSLAEAQCKKLAKAYDKARDQRLRDGQYSFDSYAVERVAIRYLAGAKLQKDSDSVWDLTCTAKRYDVDLAGKDAVKDGVAVQAIELHAAMCAIREQKPGCMSGKQFENAVSKFYAGRNGYTVNGRRMHLLRGSVPTKHLLEEKVKENNQSVRRDCDRFTVAELDTKYRALFFSVLFADDKTLAYQAPEGK